MKITWDWGKANKEVAKESKRRTVKAAEYMAGEVRKDCPVGTVSHPMYKTGPFANQLWTMRDAGMLKRSIRTAEKHGGESVYLSSLMMGQSVYGVRVYAGHYLAWYGKIVEFFTPFFGPAIERSKPVVKNILESG